MDDIKIPDEQEDEILDEEDVMHDLGSDEDSDLEDFMNEEAAPNQPASRVAITFGRFVKLVANHSFLDVVERNQNEEVVISTNLLTDLANAHDRVTERKMPIVFLVGIVLGVAVTYILLTR
ncbi:MAG: hypothetical protein ABII07_02250 [Patescibacteria group bacterium]|nr:hypothetical protein [Patescibacteria group bacterium]